MCIDSMIRSRQADPVFLCKCVCERQTDGVKKRRGREMEVEKHNTKTKERRKNKGTK